MAQTITRTGTLSDEQTLVLDEPLTLPQNRVRITVEPLLNGGDQRKSLSETLRIIHEMLAASGHVPPTAEEVDAYIRAERESWD